MGQLTDGPPTIGAALHASGTESAAQKIEPTESFRFVVSRHDKVLEYQFSVARWIMASLLVLNGGGLLSVLNAADRLPNALTGGAWFLAGAVTAVLSGSIAWINCNLITTAADYRLDWHRLDYQESPTADKLEKWALRTGVASVAMALVSLLLFSAVAVAVKNAISHPHATSAYVAKAHL